MGKYFGTDGIRGKVNNNLTSRIVFRLGRYLGARGKLKILIARDTRISSDLLYASFCSGALGSGSDVYDLGIAPTPAVSFLTNKLNFDYGVMITASHNFYEDNGIKIFDRNGEKIKEDLKWEIENYIDASEDYLPLAASEHIGKLYKSEHLTDDYIDFINKNGKVIDHNIKVLVDVANGANFKLIKTLLDKIGMVDYAIVNNQPSGTNINQKSGVLNYELLRERVLNKNYDLGVALDGDGDRIIACDNAGNILDGDMLLLLFAIDLKEDEKLKDDRIVVTTMTNVALIKTLKEKGIETDVVDVGDHNVQLKMARLNASLGGEKSGHIIFGDIANTGDALLVMIKLLALISKRKDYQKLYREYKPYPSISINIKVADKNKIIGSQRLIDFITSCEKELKSDGRIVIRPSGTESLIRVLIECEKENKINDLSTAIKNLIYDLDID